MVEKEGAESGADLSSKQQVVIGFKPPLWQPKHYADPGLFVWCYLHLEKYSQEDLSSSFKKILLMN